MSTMDVFVTHIRAASRATSTQREGTREKTSTRLVEVAASAFASSTVLYKLPTRMCCEQLELICCTSSQVLFEG